MNLPINARDAPFREKYIDEETAMLRRWFIFGSSSDGHVDLSDGTDDVFLNLRPEQADTIKRARHVFVDAVIAVLNEPPKA